MSVSQHPVAHRLAECITTPTRLLATVMGLPLLDGLFAALLISGAITSVIDAIQVGVLIIGGSATLTVILTELDGTRRQNLIRVGSIGIGLSCLAALQAVFAPTIASVIDTAIFTRFAALVLVAIGAKTTSTIGHEWIPTPGMIIAFGFIASIQPAGATVELATDLASIGYAVLAVLIGVVFAGVAVLVRDMALSLIDLDQFRIGGGISLGVVGLSLVGIVPSAAAIVVFGAAFVLAVDTPTTVWAKRTQ